VRHIAPADIEPVFPASNTVVACLDQIRLAVKFEESERAWLAFRARDPFDFNDGADNNCLTQTRLDALASRNAAASSLYEHRIRCPICKSSRQLRP
jgi:hypothetical protein